MVSSSLLRMLGTLVGDARHSVKKDGLERCFRGCCRHPQLFKFPGGSSNQSSKLLTYLAELVRSLTSYFMPLRPAIGLWVWAAEERCLWFCLNRNMPAHLLSKQLHASWMAGS